MGSRSHHRMRMFASIERPLHVLLYLSGMDMLRHATFFNVRFLFNLLDIMLFHLVEFHTIYQVRSDSHALSFCLCVVGFGCQGCSILYVFVRESQAIRLRFEDAKRFYGDGDDSEAVEDEERTKDYYLRLTVRLSMLYLISFVSVSLANIAVIIVSNCVHNEKNLLFGLDVPFFDESVSPDFELIFAYQIVQVSYGTVEQVVVVV